MKKVTRAGRIVEHMLQTSPQPYFEKFPIREHKRDRPCENLYLVVGGVFEPIQSIRYNYHRERYQVRFGDGIRLVSLSHDHEIVASEVQIAGTLSPRHLRRLEGKTSVAAVPSADAASARMVA